MKQDNNDRNLEMAEQLKMAELQILETVNKILASQTKMAENVLTKQLQLETKINALYTDRVKMMQRLNSESLSFMQRMSLQAQLGLNAMGTANASNQYIQTLGLHQPTTTSTFAGTLAGDVVGAGILANALNPSTTPTTPTTPIIPTTPAFSPRFPARTNIIPTMLQQMGFNDPILAKLMGNAVAKGIGPWRSGLTKLRYPGYQSQTFTPELPQYQQPPPPHPMKTFSPPEGGEHPGWWSNQQQLPSPFDIAVRNLPGQAKTFASNFLSRIDNIKNSIVSGLGNVVEWGMTGFTNFLGSTGQGFENLMGNIRGIPSQMVNLAGFGASYAQDAGGYILKRGGQTLSAMGGFLSRNTKSMGQNLTSAVTSAVTMFSGPVNEIKESLGGVIKRAVPASPFVAAGYGIKYGSDIVHGAARVGMSTDEYQRNQFAARATQMGNIEDVFGQYKSARDRALSGDVGARRAFQMAGVNDLSNVNRGFEQLMSSLSKGGNDVNKMAAALNIFGDNANKVINALQQGFDKFKSAATLVPESVLKALNYTKDTLSQTLQELVKGFAYLAVAMKPVMWILNQIKAGVAGVGGFIGGSSVEGSNLSLFGKIKQSFTGAIRGFGDAYSNYLLSQGNVTNQQQTDVAGIGGVTKNWQYNPFAGGYSQLADRAAHTGLFLGGAASGVQTQDLTLKNIEKYTHITADGVMTLPSKL